ncbi:VWA domain-containing protein [Alteromonas pelagimontana]|uniref:VWA domain-containing protein n=1 Tax=Alteromonas pelagimontana TaxID=1858656 RepID=A0A6M4MEM4_9ALTE|nr:vWA domain-containing protein [Alteromonas pelagimontana]QJR80616.1 VWA domain-containing protein [Alteromonas pelagimontana]
MSVTTPIKLFFALLLLACGTLAHAGPIKTDIVLLVDESGSMGNGRDSLIHANLAAHINSFSDALASQGVEARFALIGFGLAGNLFRQLSDFGSAETFSSAANQLSSGGNTEPAYDAMAFALDSLNRYFVTQPLAYATDAIKNFILFTDEGDNSREFDKSAIATTLAENSALLNAVVPSDSSTTSGFVELALETGGRVFDLNELETTSAQQAQSFLAQLGLAKAEETFDFCRQHSIHAACSGVGPPSVSESGTGALAMLFLTWLWFRRFIRG